MIVRKAQMAELGRPRRAKFEERAAEVLAKHFPERAAVHSPEAWLALVHETVEQALRMGLNVDGDVLEYAVYAVSSSEDTVAVILPEWFQQIAQDRMVTPEVRLVAISIACQPPDGQTKAEL